VHGVVGRSTDSATHSSVPAARRRASDRRIATSRDRVQAARRSLERAPRPQVRELESACLLLGAALFPRGSFQGSQKTRSIAPVLYAGSGDGDPAIAESADLKAPRCMDRCSPPLECRAPSWRQRRSPGSPRCAQLGPTDLGAGHWRLRRGARAPRGRTHLTCTCCCSAGRGARSPTVWARSQRPQLPGLLYRVDVRAGYAYRPWTGTLAAAASRSARR
jgi:hypothetical protein